MTERWTAGRGDRDRVKVFTKQWVDVHWQGRSYRFPPNVSVELDSDLYASISVQDGFSDFFEDVPLAEQTLNDQRRHRGILKRAVVFSEEQRAAARRAEQERAKQEAAQWEREYLERKRICHEYLDSLVPTPATRKTRSRETFTIRSYIVPSEGDGWEPRRYMVRANYASGVLIGEGCYWKQPYKMD